MRTTPLPSAFTFSMKRSKFFENCVPSANAVTARRVTSCANAGQPMVSRPKTIAASARCLTRMNRPPGLFPGNDSVTSNPEITRGSECRAGTMRGLCRPGDPALHCRILAAAEDILQRFHFHRLFQHRWPGEAAIDAFPPVTGGEDEG